MTAITEVREWLQSVCLVDDAVDCTDHWSKTDKWSDPKCSLFLAMAFAENMYRNNLNSYKDSILIDTINWDWSVIDEYGQEIKWIMGRRDVGFGCSIC